jgi:hypothetical protein
MRNWIKSRRNQLSILLVAAGILIISNTIIPAYETLAYYHSKVDALEMQQQQLRQFTLHIDFHESHVKIIKKQLADLHQHNAELRNSAALQKQFGKIQRECQLKVITQQFERSNISSELEKIDIRQTLDGHYSNHMSYLQEVLSPKNNMLLEQYSLVNGTLFSDNPILTADVNLILLLPKE